MDYEYSVIPIISIGNEKMKTLPKVNYKLNFEDKQLDNVFQFVIKKIAPNLKFPYVYFAIDKEILIIADTLEKLDKMLVTPKIERNIIKDLEKIYDEENKTLTIIYVFDNDDKTETIVSYNIDWII
jgi:hypothetical protein